MITRILCVEDNPQNMRLVRKILIGAGYEVVEAVNGEQALAMIEQEPLDVVLMDVNLPDIDGLEVTRRIRQMPQFNNLPIVALTANAMHGDRERCMEAGCNGYVPKPITKVELFATITQMLRQSGRAQGSYEPSVSEAEIPGRGNARTAPMQVPSPAPDRFSR